MKERRRYERRPASLLMTLKPPATEAKDYTTLDISDGGMFLLSLQAEQLPVGTIVVIEPTSSNPHFPTHPIKARIVRSSPQGMGIEVLDDKPEK